MNKKVEMGLFLGVFLLVFFLMNFYVFWRFLYFFNINSNYIFMAIIIALSASYPLAVLFEKRQANYFTRAFYVSATTWFGFVFITLSFLFVYEVLNLAIGLDKTFSGIVLLTLSLLFSVYALINNSYLVVKKIIIPVRGIERDVKIVQISDLHLGTLRSGRYFDKIVEKVNNLAPDFVAITGDIVDGSAPLNYEMLSPLNKIKSKVFYVTGNHEIYDGLENVINLMKKTKAEVLRDKAVNYKGLQIIGINYIEPREHFVRTLYKIKINYKKPSLLLYHSPEDIRIIEKAGIDLHLAGHTHGGQIFPFNLLVKIFFRNIKGLKKLGDTYQYVSMGTNVWGPPMRLTSRNEITLLILTKP